MTDCRTTLVTTTAAVADPLRSAGKRRACRLFGVPRRPRGSNWPVLISRSPPRPRWCDEIEIFMAGGSVTIVGHNAASVDLGTMSAGGHFAHGRGLVLAGDVSGPLQELGWNYFDSEEKHW